MKARLSDGLAPVATEAQPCTDPQCRGQHAPAERLALAASLCGTRGVRLTALRQQVLELLWESGRPMGAYELIEALELRSARPVGPPTVYRALAFLTSQRLVAKLESRNAYVRCVHPERRHDSLFFICGSCGGAVEFDQPRLKEVIAADAARIGFRPARRVIEVEGTCATCLGAAAD